jgi:vacuolar-type H+-ATPase subunit H
MDNNILREIIDVEKEIQQSIEQAKEMARVWLETRKKEMDERLANEEKEIVGSFHQSREKLEREAVIGAEDLVKRAEQEADQIIQLNNETLARIVAKHIHMILPGGP